jgi:acetyl esterase
LQDQASVLGLDATSITLGGDSAGASIVSAAALRLSQTAADKPAGMLLVYPSLDLSFTHTAPSFEKFADGYYLRARSCMYFRDIYLGLYSEAKPDPPVSASDPTLSVLLAKPEQLALLPPTVIFTAGYDPLRSDGDAFLRKLTAVGVACECTCFEDTIHAWMHLITLTPTTGERLVAIGEALRNLLRRK